MSEVALGVEPREIHAVIGPNGAGKTTLVGALAGELRPDAGTIRFAGHDISRLGATRRARLGIARSFQITIFRGFSASTMSLAAGAATAPPVAGAARTGGGGPAAPSSPNWGSPSAPT